MQQGNPESKPDLQTTYTAPDYSGAIVTTTATSLTISYAQGFVAITRNVEGGAQVHISAVAQACPDGTWYVDPSDSGQMLQADVTLDAQGSPTGAGDASLAENLQQMLWCRTASTRRSMHSSAILAGLDPDSSYLNGVPAFGVAASQGAFAPQLKPEECVIAELEEGVLFGAWIAFPLDPFAYWGMAVGYIHTAHTCGWA